MTRVTFRLPDSIHERAKQLAKRDGISLHQLLASAVAEKVSVLEGIDYLQARAAKGKREDLKHILAKVPSRKPLKGDELPARK
ncbi:MAG TPA: toxin-antitoxin system HicB family antitoxin [Phycisphaerae bacterium]|nr:toxin-antitoxin system HicB family antitoxin [Phycisphaerae bacterium]